MCLNTLVNALPTATFSLAESCVHVGAWQIAQKVKKKDNDLHWFYWALRPKQKR